MAQRRRSLLCPRRSLCAELGCRAQSACSSLTQRPPGLWFVSNSPPRGRDLDPEAEQDTEQIYVHHPNRYAVQEYSRLLHRRRLVLARPK